jgi:hypothetical protein
MKQKVDKKGQKKSVAFFAHNFVQWSIKLVCSSTFDVK